MLFFVLLACAPEVEPASVCPAYSGLTAAGRTWEYGAFADGSTSSRHLDALGSDKVTISGTDWADTYLCDADGLWIVMRTATLPDRTARWEYDPPGLEMPAVIEPGVAWTADAAWFYSDSLGNTSTASSSTQYDVVTTARSNVIAGAFDTVEVHVLDAEADGDTRYYADGVGLVLSDRAQLVAVGP